MLAWVAPLIVFGLVVFVHELGHFLAAKATGVYAPRFSIGFGPALWSHRHGETEYVLAALPLGGYVRMASREDEAVAFLEGGAEEGKANAPAHGGDPNAMIPFGPLPVPEHRWFESKSLAQRLIIMFAGVTMNAILALVVSIGLAIFYGEIVVPSNRLGGIHDPAPADLRAALQAGDSILSIGGTPITRWNDLQRAIDDAPGTTVDVRTNRGLVTLTVGAPGSARRDSIIGGLDWWVSPVIDSVIPGLPAAKAGLHSRDSVVAIDGAPVRTFSDLVSHVAPSAGRPVTIDVIRSGQPVRITVVPDSIKVPTVSGTPQIVGKIGAAQRDISIRRPVGIGTAVVLGTRQTIAMGGAVIGTVRDLILRRVSVKELGGPIAIASASVSAARNGIAELFGLLAFLSINVAVLNLLPIPILDGGNILINIAETIKGRAFSARTREYIQRAGLVAIALLFVLVMFNDVTRLVRRFIS